MLDSSRALDRTNRLRAAEDWRAKRKPKKAIAELRRILEVEPSDPQVHARLAPLLVMTGDAKSAIPSLRIAARDLEARGFADRAVSLHLQLADIDPRDLGAWEMASRLHVHRGRTAEAVKVLRLGARRQRGADGGGRALRLLREAVALASSDRGLLLELARSERRAGHASEARSLLDRALSISDGGPGRRQVRWVSFVLFPSLSSLWRWLRG